MVLPNCALIREAFVHVKKQRQGISLVQIGKHLEATYQEKLDAKKKKFITSTFKSLVQEGKLMRKGALYKSTRQRGAIVRADVPRRRYQRAARRPRRYRKPLRKRQVPRRRRHYKVHLPKGTYQKYKNKYYDDQLDEPPDYTNSVPSVEVSEQPRTTSRSSNRRN